MRSLLVIIFIAQITIPSSAQIDDEATLAFQPELDSVVIHAWNSGIKELEVDMWPYQLEHSKRVSKEVAKWYFINDSIVEQHLWKRKYYGLRQGNCIREYDFKIKKVVEYPDYSRDSLQFRIFERTSYWNKNRNWSYERSITDTIADSSNYYRSNSSGGSSFQRTVKLSDTSSYTQFWQTTKDSTYLAYENWGYALQSNEPEEFKSLSITKSHYSYFLSAVDTFTSLKYYSYDAKNRLSKIFRVDYNTGSSVCEKETYEMQIIYKED